MLATRNINDCKSTIFLGAIGYYSLFPLLFRPELLLVKVSYYLAYMLLSWICLKHIHRTLHLNIVEILYIFGLSSLLVYEHCVQYLIGFDKKLPFLPLLMTSVYCALGVLYFYCQYYVRFLLNTEIVHRSSKHKHKMKWNKLTNVLCEIWIVLFVAFVSAGNQANRETYVVGILFQGVSICYCRASKCCLWKSKLLQKNKCFNITWNFMKYSTNHSQLM